MKTILHITFSAITDYLGEGLQIEESLKNGMQVHILEINSLFNFSPPEHSKKYSNLVMKIRSFEQLGKVLLSHDPTTTVVNVQMVYEWRFRKIFRLIAKNQEYSYTIFLLGQLPFHANNTLRKRIAKASVSKILIKAKNKLLSKILLKIKYLKLQDVMFYAGESLSKGQPYSFQFPVNYFDYDQYLKNPEKLNDNFLLFLDDALFNHPDDEIVGNRTNEDIRGNYKIILNLFFDQLEALSGKKIIIASHPKVNHPPGSFGNREIVKHKTRELVQRSSFVFAHFSSSISYAVCYEKPIYFLTCGLITEFSKKNQPISDYINSLAKELAAPIINMDDNINSLPNFDKITAQDHYQNFKMNYLTSAETKGIESNKLIKKYFEAILKIKNSKTHAKS